MRQLRKQYELDGLIGNSDSLMIVDAKIITNVTNDGKLCSLSVAIKDTNLQITIPLNQILRDLGVR